MNLVITTPLSVVVDEKDISSLRAEDASGAFGIQRGHDAFLTVLEPSVLLYRKSDIQRYVAVRGGILVVKGGDIGVATREAYVGDDLDKLEALLLAGLEQAHETELQARTEGQRLQLAAIRHLQNYLEASRRGHLGEDAP